MLDVLARVQQNKRASDIGDFIIVGRARGQRLGMIVQGLLDQTGEHLGTTAGIFLAVVVIVAVAASRIARSIKGRIAL